MIDDDLDHRLRRFGVEIDKGLARAADQITSEYLAPAIRPWRALASAVAVVTLAMGVAAGLLASRHGAVRILTSPTATTVPGSIVLQTAEVPTGVTEAAGSPSWVQTSETDAGAPCGRISFGDATVATCLVLPMPLYWASGHGIVEITRADSVVNVWAPGSAELKAEGGDNPCWPVLVHPLPVALESVTFARASCSTSAGTRLDASVSIVSSDGTLTPATFSFEGGKWTAEAG